MEKKIKNSFLQFEIEKKRSPRGRVSPRGPTQFAATGVGSKRIDAQLTGGARGPVRIFCRAME